MDYLKNIHCKDDKYIYQDKNICFEFNKLSNFLQDKKYKRILESYDRIKNFYNGTIVLNLKYRNTNIIVGYTYLPFETLHVVNEYIKNGVKMIMDWKNNLCMSEEEYIKLTGFKQLEVITNKTIEKNKKIINLLGLKFYLLFANELNDELNKLNDRLDKKFIKKITG